MIYQLTTPTTLPKFAIGQTVKFLYEIDDPVDTEFHGQTVSYEGRIYGISWGHPERRSLEGWFYSVLWLESSLPCEALPIWDTEREENLEIAQ